MLPSKFVLIAACTLAVLGSSAATQCADGSQTWTGNTVPQPTSPPANSTATYNYCYKIGASSGSGAEQKNLIIWSGSDTAKCDLSTVAAVKILWVGQLFNYDNIDYACCNNADRCNLALSVTVGSAMLQPSLLLLLSVLAAMAVRSLLL